MTTLYTATPWVLHKGGTAYYPLSIRAGNTEIASFHTWDATKEANAQFIVTACNAHADLVAALRGMLDAFHQDPSERDTTAATDAAYAALAQATTKENPDE